MLPQQLCNLNKAIVILHTVHALKRQCCLQLQKLEDFVRSCGGGLPQGWSVRRIPCFAGRYRPIYVPPQVLLLAGSPCVRCAICGY